MAVIESGTFGHPEDKPYADSRITVLVSTAEGNLEMLSDVVELKWETPVTY